MTTIIGVSGKKRAGKNTTFALARILLDEDETGKVMRFGFADALKEMAVQQFDWNGAKDETGRKLLQNLGVAMRSVDENYWVRKVMDRLPYLNDDTQVVFITDCRFVNEADAIRKQAGGVVWRVNRPSMPFTDTHVSETALDDYEFDYVINADTLDDLFKGVKDGLRGLDLYEEP
jgi:hypothetical protein